MEKKYVFGVALSVLVVMSAFAFGSLLATAATGVCGDGAINLVGEECDDGNKVSGDGCNAICQREYCGDGIKQTKIGEQCDGALRYITRDGIRVIYNLNTTHFCNNKCQIALGQPVCGDGLVNNLPAVEQCDDGNLVSGDKCSSTCKKEFCGDGIVQSTLLSTDVYGNKRAFTEQCDFGTVKPGALNQTAVTNGGAGPGCDRWCHTV
jgi:cysteine-rich repeat protein